MTPQRRLLLAIGGWSLIGLSFIGLIGGAESLATVGHPWYFFRNHALWLLIGWGGLLFAAALPKKLWQQIAPFLFGLGWLLLLLVLIPGLGIRTQGAQRWLNLGPLSFQPAEAMKVALILGFSAWFSQHQRFAPFLFLTAGTAGLVLLQPNLSMATLLTLIAVGVYFIAGGRIAPLLGFGLLGIIAFGLLVFTSPYRRERLLTYLDPMRDPYGRSYHIRQISIALGRGGLFGVGPGLSQQKYRFVPEATTDSIVAIMGEEIGWIGITIFLGGWILFLRLILDLALHTTDRFAQLYIGGLVTWLSFQSLANLAAISALVPLTGVPFPLISYGGSSLFTSLVALGIAIGITKEVKPPSRKVHENFPRRTKSNLLG